MSSAAGGAKRFLKRWSRRILAGATRALGSARGGNLTRGLRVLTYHRIFLDPADPFAVSPEEFSRQMEALMRTGSVVILHEAMSDLGKPEGSGSRIAITFDDGTVDFLTNAASVLSRFRLPATLFVNPTRVGTPGFLGWNELRELVAAGVSVESHGLDHRSLARLETEELRRQLSDSRWIIEDRLGRGVTFLAYPYGTFRDFNSLVKEKAKEAGYRSAFTSVNGVNLPGGDPFELRRTKIEQGDGPIFDWILRGGIDGWCLVDKHLVSLQNRYA